MGELCGVVQTHLRGKALSMNGRPVGTVRDRIGSWVGPHFMLLSQEFGKLPVAPHSLLRQAGARPLHQHKIVLVDRSRWHLWRMRLVGKRLLAH